MPYQLTIVEKPGYLHATVAGENTVENVRGYLRELQEACVTHRCSRVLIEERLTGRRLETFDVYQIASEGSSRARGVFDAVAFVDVNASGELMKFAETVANNRGVPMTLFSSVAEAERWLSERR
jgi:hypothetical protein